ncbi:RdRP-domain-containing protein [Auriculariales sp. MPI-PUGE-AT-0066]|nr:RdRP-domain-containing protein [Auriculariales sp. MPI-PUGE-AT-0066]
MEIQFSNFAYAATEDDLVDALVKILHGPNFAEFNSEAGPLYFVANLRMRERTDRRKKNRTPGHSGYGTIIIPNGNAARRFMALHGVGIFVSGRKVNIRLSPDQPSQELLTQLNSKLWQHPRDLRQKHERAMALAAAEIKVTEVQFGWPCRDGVFSAETSSTSWSSLIFEDAMKGIVLKPNEEGFPTTDMEHIQSLFQQFDISRSRQLPPAVVIKYRHVDMCTISSQSGPSIIFELAVAPSFEREPLPMVFPKPGTPEPRRTRLTFPATDPRLARYVTRFVRIVLASDSDVIKFKRAWEVAGQPSPDRQDFPVQHRGLFSTDVLNQIDTWLRSISFTVAMQLQTLLFELLVDGRELLELKQAITDLIAALGSKNAAKALRSFSEELKSSPWYLEGTQESAYFLQNLLTAHRDRVQAEAETPFRVQPAGVATLHVTLSPSAVSITGPVLEQGNRIIRRFATFQHHFIRIGFVDDDGQLYRYDPHTDTAVFVRSQLVPVMTNGFRLGGRLFEYLAYSQSALKQHSFWFVHAFKDTDGALHNAASIRADMGDFSADERCPARVAARMSLAFSGTDPSARLLPEERMQQPDIGEEGAACMTDGAGLMSVASAEAMWLARCQKRNIRNPGPCPSVIQVRIGGDKGVLVKDPTLGPGRRIIIRDSMSKFTADSRFDEVEICKAFTKPGVAFLNRPLITVLEARGAPIRTFLRLQQHIVDDIMQAKKNLSSAAALLRTNSLGTSFILPFTLAQLADRTTTSPNAAKAFLGGDEFIERTLTFGINHVLRGLKFRGRIPIPNSWNLVGVPDSHGLLKAGEIFACVRESEFSQVNYLNGPVMVSRSPTSHPGDVMVMNAIGKPPRNSAFAVETPTNCVVFSTQGTRSPGSCLGGGDYDGDEYLVSTYSPLYPRPDRPFEPAMYKNSLKKLLDRPYEMSDIIDTNVNFILNDQLGRVASLWLKIADRSGVDDERCLRLSHLHAVACDFPKTGTPVDLGQIPHAPQMIPDWSVDEIGPTNPESVYPSDKALGHLYRAIHLPAEDEADEIRGLRREGTGRAPLKFNKVATSIAQDQQLAKHPLRLVLQDWIAVLAPKAFTNDTNLETSSMSLAVRLFNSYYADLRTICHQNTLARSRRAALTEEEVTAGTIVTRTRNYRKREDHMTRMNEQSEKLRERVQAELEGGPDAAVEPYVRVHRAWMAWKISVVDKGFGSGSFGLIALAILLLQLKEIEEKVKDLVPKK